jgi:hypothetical protein
VRIAGSVALIAAVVAVAGRLLLSGSWAVILAAVSAATAGTLLEEKLG